MRGRKLRQSSTGAGHRKAHAGEVQERGVHLSHRDVTLIGFSRAPIDRLIAYKQRMGWQFPTSRPMRLSFRLTSGSPLTPEQAQEVPEVKEIIDYPPEWLQDSGRQVGAKLEDGLREGPERHRVRARERQRVPHLHGDGTRSVGRPLPLVPAPTNAEGRARGAPRLAQGRVRGLIAESSARLEPVAVTLGPRHPGAAFPLATRRQTLTGDCGRHARDEQHQRSSRVLVPTMRERRGADGVTADASVSSAAGSWGSLPGMLAAPLNRHGGLLRRLGLLACIDRPAGG
jgi:Bacterial protein of unknown function (DUF899)